MEISIVLKRLLIVLLVLSLTAFAVSKAVEYYVSATTPDFLEKLEKATMTSPYISARIGKRVGFESTYNENDLATDTVRFKVKIRGESSNLLLSGKAVRKGEDWVPVKIDSVYQKN